MRKLLLGGLLVSALTGCGPSTPVPHGQTEGPLRDGSAVLHTDVVHAQNGMVASDAALATRVGVQVLRDGGNAVDAAVATAFALAVVYPEAGNLGGGGFMVARMSDGTTGALDFREKAPLAATRDMFLDKEGNLTNKSLTGHLASGVPGAVAGLYAAHQRFGSKPWSQLLEPAIRLAEQGFKVDEHFSDAIAAQHERLAQFAGTAALLLPNGKPPAVGSTWRNPDLAAVLRRMAEQGPRGFYEGETARLIVEEMKRGGGIISLDDLKQYDAKWRDPVAFDYRGHTIVSMPPASSGGLTLALMANIVEGYDLKQLGFHTARSLHVIAEASRRAFADRNHFLGDSDFVDPRREMFLSEQYAERQRSTMSLDRATPSSQVHPGMNPVVEGDHTTHFSVVDAQGNAVALTTTINELFGSAVTVTGAGFLLNDEMDDFAAKPGTPNMFGLVQGEQNAIQPGKRMLSAMTPTIVLDSEGQPLLITGARGGPRIISAVFQIITHVIDYDMQLGEALSASRIHHQHLPDMLYFERGGLPEETVNGLEARGHKVSEREGYIGSGPTIMRTAAGWAGAADPRSGGLAAGH